MSSARELIRQLKRKPWYYQTEIQEVVTALLKYEEQVEAKDTEITTLRQDNERLRERCEGLDNIAVRALDINDELQRDIVTKNVEQLLGGEKDMGK